MNTKESSIGLPYCGFICKCYRGIDIQLRKTGDRVLGRGGEAVTCLLVISPLMKEVEFSPTDLEGPVCIELPSYKSQKIVVIHEVGLYEDYPSLTI